MLAVVFSLLGFELIGVGFAVGLIPTLELFAMFLVVDFVFRTDLFPVGLIIDAVGVALLLAMRFMVSLAPRKILLAVFLIPGLSIRLELIIFRSALQFTIGGFGPSSLELLVVEILDNSGFISFLVKLSLRCVRHVCPAKSSINPPI